MISKLTYSNGDFSIIRHSEYSDYFEFYCVNGYWSGIYENGNIFRKSDYDLLDENCTIDRIHSIREIPKSYFVYLKRKDFEDLLL